MENNNNEEQVMTSNQIDTGFKVTDKRLCFDEDGDDNQAEEPVELIPSYVEKLKENALKHETQLKEYLSAYKKKMAENDAYLKRQEENFKLKFEKAKGDIIQTFLPVIDNLERALSTAVQEGVQNSLFEGIKMVRDLFQEQMKQNGVSLMESQGKIFDPKTEEAVALEEVTDKEKDNKVLEEFEKGYLLGDRLLRPAKVKVGKFVSKSA